MLAQVITTILVTYLISLGLQLICLPITRKLFSRLPDEGYPISRILTTLSASLIIWEVSNFGIPANTNNGLLIATTFLVAVNLFTLIKQKEKRNFTKEKLKVWAIEEYLFFVGYLGISIVRSYLPNIDSLEKFMDFGFVNRYLLSPTLPAMDMWQAGSPINYYSFGHFWSSIVIRYFGVLPAVGYNLALAFIAGLSLSISFSAVYCLIGAKKGISGFVGGLIGAMATVLAGNSHVIWYLIKNHSLNAYWYAEATRFIHNTIHEFPSYSFVVADLHGHVIGLPFVLTFILIYIHWLKSRKIVDEIIMGILFGVMMMTNTWDVPIYGMVLVISGLFLVMNNQHEFIKLLRAAGVMLIFMMLTALPWFLTFQSISQGIRLVQERSPLWQLAALWLGGLLVCLMAILTTRKDENKLPVWVLSLSVCLLILIPEIVYAKDIYPDHPRANTMFKLTYQASVMIGILMGTLLGKLFDRQTKIGFSRWVFLVVAGTIFTGIMIFPAEAFPNFYENFNKIKSLDGESWLAESSPEKYGAVMYLRNHRNGKNMAEAVGDSYTHFNAVSVFSGIPTIQGWRVHEWLWRGGYDPVAIRETEVKAIYEGKELENARRILNKYNVGWIFVGNDEHSTYNIDDKLLLRLGNIVWQQGDSYLIQVN